MRPHRRVAALLALAPALLATPAHAAPPAAAPPPAAPPAAEGPPLTVVHTFPDSFHLVGIGASKAGRVFATDPTAADRHGPSMLEVHPGDAPPTPYPDASWNAPTGADPTQLWGHLQALYDDAQDHLWALDTGNAAVPPKLVEFDLATNRPIHTYAFPAGTLADALNDVRVDVPHRTAYLTAAGNHGGLVVLDLASGHSRLVLADDRSAVPAPGQHLLIAGQPALRPDGSQVRILTDGIAISPDAAWLYYRPLNDHNYWRIPTAALRDARLSPKALAAKVQFLGTGAMSGGLDMDAAGTLFAGDIENATVVALTLHGTRLHERVYVRAPGQLAWADGFAISGNQLYFADSHLNEVAFKNDLPRSGPFAIFRVPLPRS